jgi:hypothetical protein
MKKDMTGERESVTRSSIAEPAETPRKNGPPSVRYASDEQFKKAHEKTSKLHAALFRRLAQ